MEAVGKLIRKSMHGLQNVTESEQTKYRAMFVLALFVEVENATGVQHDEMHVENTLQLLENAQVGQRHMEAARIYILQYVCRYVTEKRLVRFPDFFPTEEDLKKTDLHIGNLLKKEFYRGLNQGRQESYKSEV